MLTDWDDPIASLRQAKQEPVTPPALVERTLAGLNTAVQILTGKAKGTTGLFKNLVSEFLGAERAEVSFETQGKTRRLKVGKKIDGEVFPVKGKSPDKDIVAVNTNYWMGSDITVATASKGRVRAFGRVWDFDGRSAEICSINWQGPER